MSEEDRCNTHNNPTFVLDGTVVCPKCVEENKKHMPTLWRHVQARVLATDPSFELKASFRGVDMEIVKVNNYEMGNTWQITSRCHDGEHGSTWEGSSSLPLEIAIEHAYQNHKAT